MEQLANILKNFKVNSHNKALDHYREMAWLPFQKSKKSKTNIKIKKAQIRSLFFAANVKKLTNNEKVPDKYCH